MSIADIQPQPPLLETPCTAFGGHRRIASGRLEEVALAAKAAADDDGAVLVFDDRTGDVLEIDYRGTEADVLRRLAARAADQDAAARVLVASDAPARPDTPTRPDTSARPDDHTRPAAQADTAPRGPGRPRLGVVPREVTLLPRHWTWLSSQPGGASVALRRLVDEARRANVGRDRVRRSQEVTYRFMSALAGNLPGFEEALRALFSGDERSFEAHIAPWPADVRSYARGLATDAFTPGGRP